MEPPPPLDQFALTLEPVQPPVVFKAVFGLLTTFVSMTEPGVCVQVLDYLVANRDLFASILEQVEGMRTSMDAQLAALQDASGEPPHGLAGSAVGEA